MKFVKYTLFLVAFALVLFKVILPKLVSAPSDLAILCALAIVLIVPYYLSKWIKDKVEDEL